MQRFQKNDKAPAGMSRTNKVLIVGGSIAAISSNALALPIVVDTASTISDMAIAFTAILAIAVIVFGYSKIASMF